MHLPISLSAAMHLKHRKSVASLKFDVIFVHLFLVTNGVLIVQNMEKLWLRDRVCRVRVLMGLVSRLVLVVDMNMLITPVGRATDRQTDRQTDREHNKLT